MPNSDGSSDSLERLPYLVQGITTSGNRTPDADLLCELCSSCCKNHELIEQLFHLLSTQLRQKHSQIRLGVLMLATQLACPSFVFRHLKEPADNHSVSGMCSLLRNTLLTNIQDWSAYLLATDPDGPSLPPPAAAADEAKRVFLTTLLDWEDDLKEGVLERDQSVIPSDASAQPLNWSPTSLARGQFKGFLNFLRCCSPSNRAPSTGSCSGLSQVRALLNSIVQVRTTERERIRAAKDTEIRRRRRRLRKCLSEIKDSSDRIEENLTTLANLLELLVPDPFNFTSYSAGANVPTEDNSNTSANSPCTNLDLDTQRAHGRLCGTSSGFGLDPVNIEIHLPRVVGSECGSTQFSLPVQRTEEVKLLEESARERASVARNVHKSLLLNWLKVLSSNSSFEVDCTLRSECEAQLARVRDWLERLQRLTHLFFDRLVFTDAHGAVLQPVSESSSDASDLEDVNPVVVEPKPTALEPKSNTDNKPERPCTSSTTSGNTEIEERIPLPPSMNLLEFLSGESTVIWRATESEHPFWRPVDADEYVAPKEYIEDAISCAPISKEIRDNISSSSPIHLNVTNSQPETGTLTSDSTNQLICWAPLLSNRLCPRRDPSGRCPIHGRIVKRDPVSGRPVDPADRNLLHAEAADKHQAILEAKLAEKKRQARRRFPGLLDLNKKPDTSRTRLSSRIFKKKALLRVVNDLEIADRKAIASRFSDNFVHSVKPK